MHVSVVSNDTIRKVEAIADSYANCPKILGREASQIGLLFCDRLLARLNSLVVEVEGLATEEAKNLIFNEHDQEAFRWIERKLVDAEAAVRQEKARLKQRAVEIQKPGHVVPGVDKVEREKFHTDVPF